MTRSTDVDHVLVTLDGSPFAERALTPARWLSHHLGVPVRALYVAGSHARRGRYLVEERLQELAAAGAIDAWTVSDVADPVAGIADAVGFGDRVLACMATHGRGRTAALVGSVARAVASEVPGPLVLVGPCVVRTRQAEEVVVAAEGSPDDADLARVGADWAELLGARLVLVTVVEDAPDPITPGAVRHHVGSSGAAGHLADLVAGLSSPPVAMRTDVVVDPVRMRDGVTSWLAGRAPSMLVVGARRDRALRRFLAGDHCSQLVHAAPVPALVVPIGLRS